MGLQDQPLNNEERGGGEIIQQGGTCLAESGLSPEHDEVWPEKQIPISRREKVTKLKETRLTSCPMSSPLLLLFLFHLLSFLLFFFSLL